MRRLGDRDVGQFEDVEKRLRLTQYAMDHFSDCVVWLDADGLIVYSNDTTSRVTGYSREELAGMHVWEISPDYQPGKYREVWEYLKRGGWVTAECTIVTRAGQRFPAEVRANYVKFEDRELAIAFVHSIVERRLAEAALAESEEKFRVLADTSLTGIYLVQENKFVYVNPAALASLGYSAHEIIGKDFWIPVHPEFRDEIKKYGMALLHGLQIPGRFEIRFVRKDGTTGWGDMTIAPVRYHGRPAGVVTAMDITERKRAQLALAESEEKFRVLAELSPTAIFLYQGDRLIYANPAAMKFTGFTMGELLTKNFWDMVHPEYRELVRMYGLARQKGEPVPVMYEVKYIAKGGQERWAEFTAGRIEYKGMPAGIVTAIDTTERKMAEIAVREARRQAELYLDLMGHDINNMNQAALGFLEIVSERMALRQPTGVEELRLVDNAMDALSRSTDLINTVRKLQKERSGGLKPGVMDLKRVLEDVRKQHAQVPGRDVVISFLPACSCHVLANELLKDVFSNIVGNAIKHSEGTVAINIKLDVAEEQGRQFCRVAVEDTGPGITDERKKVIFERSRGDMAKLKGKGLGLYLVKTLVDDYHGLVRVEDRVPGDYTKGARFVVMLPAVPGPGKDAAEGADACSG